MKHHIKHNVRIECNAAKVYKAITTKEGIQGWWTVDTVIVPEIGSTAEFLFGCNGFGYPGFKILAIPI